MINLVTIGSPTSWSKLEETNDQWQLLITPSFLDKRRIQTSMQCKQKEMKEMKKNGVY
jgi:hypothetical protein